MEFLERLEAFGEGEERWLVQSNGEPHVVWFMSSYDRSRLEDVEAATRPWIGTIHPRVTTLRSIRWHDERLVFETDDDRGPLVETAAGELVDPIERERWVIAQFIAIADGLATLRSRDKSYVHRQLEPERMYIDIAGRARLRAPIAQLLQGPRPGHMGAAVVMGQPGYMSPEQAAGREVTAASDVFALATNLYEALTGELPFRRDSFMAVLQAILMDPTPPITTHAPGLARVLERAFAKDVKDRYPDPGTFAGELWKCVPDATDYDEVVSDRIVAWRANAPSEPSRQEMFGTKCRMKWDALEPRTQDIRHCTSCKQDVVRVRSIAAIVPLLGQRCVSYTGGD